MRNSFPLLSLGLVPRCRWRAVLGRRALAQVEDQIEIRGSRAAGRRTGVIIVANIDGHLRGSVGTLHGTSFSRIAHFVSFLFVLIRSVAHTVHATLYLETPAPLAPILADAGGRRTHCLTIIAYPPKKASPKAIFFFNA